jgi:SAM-dependent methyltransferase
MTTFFNSDSDTLKVSISTVILSKVELGVLMNQVAEISTNLAVAQSIRLNYPHQFKSKLITHSGSSPNTACYSEKITKKRVNISGNKEYTVLIVQTGEQSCNAESVQSISLTHALSYTLFQYPEWSLNIQVTKVVGNPQEFTTRLQEYKTRLLKDYKNFATELDESAYDMIAIELQFNGTTISKSDLVQVITYIDQLVANTQTQDYQQMIYSVAKEIYYDQMTASRFKERSGFKQLTPSAVELSRTIYFKDVLPVIDQFYITDKIDGSRTLLQITEYFKRNGRKKTLLGADIVSLSNEIQVIQSFDKKPSNLRGIDVVKTILDTEMIVEDGKPSFQAFDVIMLQGKKVSNLPFKQRFKEFQSINELLKQYKLGRTKTFIKLTKDKYKQQLEDFYEAALASDYEIDGIIFTPEGMYYKDAVKQKIRTNTEYYNTISFKWKPLEQSTIDFYMMPIAPDQAKALLKSAGKPSNSSEHLYALCSGVDIITFKKLNLEFFAGYTPPESENSAQYFPIQFAPYDNPFMYLWSSKEADLGGRVAEFKFVEANGTMLKKPEIVRMRDDRSNDVRKGEYFGNALRYSELIWHSIKHPLTFEMLGMAQTDLGGYFAANSESDYFAQRAFNSFVKGELIKTYLKPVTKSDSGSIIDLGAGKGQELARVIDLGFNDITMADRDIDALYELLQRKYNLRLKTKDASASVHIRQIDFENAYEDTISTVAVPTQLDTSMMNFAIHYLCHDKTEHNKNLPISDLFKLINHVLKPKGRFLITCFDGQTIFNMLEGQSEWTTGNKKYSIKKAYTSDVLTDLNQAIDVLLPFSGGSYYREYLVNMKFIESIANDHGLTMIANDSFSSMLRQFKKSNSKVYGQMDEADKEYVSLYSFAVFEKQ